MVEVQVLFVTSQRAHFQVSMFRHALFEKSIKQRQSSMDLSHSLGSLLEAKIVPKSLVKRAKNKIGASGL